MKENTRIARAEYKNMIETIGWKNIKNLHITEVVNRTGVSYCEMQNACSYFRFSKTQEKFRAAYGID